MSDIWRPTSEPARSIYDVIRAEAIKRPGRSVDEWLEAELKAVWFAARDYAQQHGLPAPTLRDIKSAERSACGHTDYGAQWAYGVARRLAHPKQHTDGGAVYG
ncbi:hypothetical protein [Bordetella bronchiseptica]|uniref:hypothetical protein n=1 Tax=Bordetella bronchiseptica TaxID=518 RepID=UPI0012484027|nr:hypothetical protein [Bordetella bronchiseptica]KAB1444163.1 hypothetical protein F7D00_21110 [Bordetella bronchiseptica]KAB1569269.1 hypothetical protein F7890_21110 [Bordetella bronchiseptica]